MNIVAVSYMTNTWLVCVCIYVHARTYTYSVQDVPHSLFDHSDFYLGGGAEIRTICKSVSVLTYGWLHAYCC